MVPYTLATPRLVLDQPTSDDVETIQRVCQDPLFERFLSTPWPYRREHAEAFVGQHVPEGWRLDREFTWALRLAPGAPLLGVIGVRLARPVVGYWLAPEVRGHGYMPEAVSAVADRVFARGLEILHWECVVGNTASLAVARKCGFTYTGSGPGAVPARDGSSPHSWQGELRASDDRAPKQGWPA